MLKPASIRINLLPRAAQFCPAPPRRQMRPSQCAVAILRSRMSGAISVGARSTSRLRRSSARSYVSTKAKGRTPTANSPIGCFYLSAGARLS
jgi:hypothetical protein